MSDPHGPSAPLGPTFPPLEPRHDTAEGAFEVHLPAGWPGRALTVRAYGAPRSLVESSAPDGSVHLFYGDPNLPAYTLPAPGAWGTPAMPVHPYVPAEPYLAGYVEQRWRGAPGLRVESVGPSADLEASVRADAERRGMAVHVTSARVAFAYVDGPRRVRGLVVGSTMGFAGGWVPDVSGILTADGQDPATWWPLLLRVRISYRTNPAWAAARDAAHAARMQQIGLEHEAAMGQLRSNHQANMAALHGSMAAHQSRMDALHATADARDRAWAEAQASSHATHGAYMDGLRGAAPGGSTGPQEDLGHGRFIDAIRGQETVVAPDGHTYAVEAGHERYWRHRRDGTTLGTDAHVEQGDLRARFGVNPDDYEELVRKHR